MKTKLDKTSILILGFLAAVTLLVIISIAAQGRKSFFGKAEISVCCCDKEGTGTPKCSKSCAIVLPSNCNFADMESCPASACQATGASPTPACILRGTVQSDINCRSLSVQRVGGGATYKVGDRVSLSARLDAGNYGIIYYKKPISVLGIERSGYEELCDGSGGPTGQLTCTDTLTLTQPGTYHFTANSYDSDACRLLCPSTGQMRKNKMTVPPHTNCSGYGILLSPTPLPPAPPPCDTTHWECLGLNTCSNSCQTTITVGEIPTTTPTSTPTPTPTATPTQTQTITIQGRIYLDDDSQLNGRGGVGESPIGPGAWDRGNNLDWNACWAGGPGTPLTFDVATWGVGRTMTWGLVNVGNNPNFFDVCGHQIELERGKTGSINETSPDPRYPSAPNPAVAGGFSLTIDPLRAVKRAFGGVEYYILRVVLTPSSGCRITYPTPTNFPAATKTPDLVFGDWLITEVFWGNTTPVVIPTNPTPGATYEIAGSPYYGLRCDYNYIHAGTTAVQTGPVVCNVCFGGDTSLREESALTCNMTADGALQESNDCLLENYKAAHYAGILVPVQGSTTRNLWIGVNKKETVDNWTVSRSQAPQAQSEAKAPVQESFWINFLQIINQIIGRIRLIIGF